MKSTISITIFCILMLVGGANAQKYDLDWSDRYVDNQVVEKALDEKSVAPAPASPRRRIPRNAVSNQKSTWDGGAWEQTYTVNIVANQSYDTYGERYRKVARVESLVYRGGYPADIVHCNRASYDVFNVAIDDLEPGDRFEVRVTWDDGSHRTIERTITESPQTQVFINEPLHFDSAFGS